MGHALINSVRIALPLFLLCAAPLYGADAPAEKRSVSLVQGSPINLDLKNVTLNDMLLALDKQSGAISFIEQPSPVLPMSVENSETKSDFSFSGSYWTVVDRLLAAFPVPAPGPGEREDLESDRWLSTLTPLDLHGPSFNAGALRLRVARIVRERGPGGEFLSLVVLPFLEPRFTFDDFKFKIEKVIFDGKREVLIENCEFEPEFGLNHAKPSRDYRICIPMKTDYAGARTATIEGTIVLKSYELTTHTHEFIRAGGYDLPGGIKFNLEKENDGAFNLRYTGKGNFPFGLSHALDNGGLVCLDKDGKTIEISARGGGAGTGGGAWNLSKRITISGKAAQIKLIAPLPRQPVTQPFAMRDLILPRADAPAALHAKSIAPGPIEEIGEFPVDASTLSSPAAQAAAAKEILKLDADDFDQREQAARALAKMDLPLLAWLRSDLEKDAKREKYAGETRDRLNRIVRAMEQRNHAAVIRHGNRVSLNLTGTLKDFLAELHRQTGNAFNGIERDDNRVPQITGYEPHEAEDDNAAPARHALKFEGTYWGAMDRIFKLFPPEPWEPGKPERIDLTSGSSRITWEEADLADPHASHASAGIIRVRVARAGWERGAGGEFFSMVLIPLAEPRYMLHEVKLEAPKLLLDGRTALESSSISLPLSMDSDGDVHRGCELWAKAGPGIPRAKTLSLSAKLNLSVIELVPATLDISRGAESYLLPCGIEVHVGKTPDGHQRIRLEGAGQMRNGLSERTDETAFVFLDKNGKVIATENDDYDSGEEWDDEDESATWYFEGTAKFKNADAIVHTVKLLTPIQRPPVTIPIHIPGIQLPASGR